MPTDTPHTIADLARLTDVTPRTVRYYIAQGLLPTPGESGPGAHYGSGHLDRLQLIRRLQRQHLPLAEIRTRLARLNDQEIYEALQTAGAEPAPDGGSALDYIRTVLGSSPTISAQPSRVTSSPAMPSRGVAGPPPPAAAEIHEPAPFALMAKAFTPSIAGESAPAEAPESFAEPPPTPAPAAEPTIERSQWERLSLGPNVELHIRRPLSRYEQKRVDRLITIARQVLQEGTK